MSLYFLINNVHFALELMGAVVLLMAAWLTLDTYHLRKEMKTLSRAIGLGLFALWQAIYALSTGSDVLLYAGFALFVIGMILVIGSFLAQERLQMQAIVVIPAFELWNMHEQVLSALLFFGVAYASYAMAKREFNTTWSSFSAAFLLLGISSLIAIFDAHNEAGLLFIIEHIIKFVSFILLAKWVWQYLQLRIRESLILIFISVALFLSTVVTLAFSTILIAQMTSDTQKSLLTDARVLNLSVDSLKEESLAKTALIAQNTELTTAVAKNDFTSLDQLATQFLESDNLGFLTITDAQGSVLVRAHALSRRGDSLIGEHAFEEARAGQGYVTIENSPVEKLSIRAGAPLIQNKKIIGTVIAGYPLDNAMVDNIKRVTGLEMFIYNNDTSVAATALASDGRTRLTGVTLQDAQVKQEVLGSGQAVTAQATISGQSYLASYLPLMNGDDKIIGMISAGKPQQDILDIADATNRLTLITVILIMFVLSYPIYVFTKRLTEEE